MKLLCALGAALLLAGCTSSGSSVPAAAEPTWGKSYADTTCRDWLTVMTPAELLTASRDLIRRLEAKDTSDAFASQFIDNVGTACKGSPSMSISDTAAGLATIDTTDFR